MSSTPRPPCLTRRWRGAYFAGGSDDPSDLARAAGSPGDAGRRPAGGRVAGVATKRTPAVCEARAWRRSLWVGSSTWQPRREFATRGALPYLPNGREVVLPGFGHTQSFFGDQPSRHAVDPDPGRRSRRHLRLHRVGDGLHAAEHLWVTGEGLVGTMLALSALMLVMLAVLGRRRRTRDQLGRTTELLTRSVGAVVLGLGGWSLVPRSSWRRCRRFGSTTSSSWC